jgi:hypothetical protein
MLVATRTLTLRTRDVDKEIPIRIFAPVQQDGGGWLCRFEIDWPDRRKIMEAGGADSIQALLIALQIISANIYTSTYHESGDLFWDAPGKGYGFPVPSNLRDLLVGDDAKYF